MTSSSLGSSEVRRIAATGLRDHDDVVRVAPDRWRMVLADLVLQRLTGLAVAAWEGGRLDVAPESLEELLERHRDAMAVAITLERRLIDVMSTFETDGVRAVVLKGPAVAHGVYPDPSMRPFGDLDLMVSTADWRAACESLRAMGYRRQLPEPRKGFDERFGKAATHADAEGYQVDLHRTLVLGPFGLWLDPEELIERTDTFVIGGQTIERLDATGMMLNAALHASLGASPPLPVPLRDVAQLARDSKVDWDRLAGWAARWRVGAALNLAFDLVERRLGIELPEESRVIRAVEPSQRDRRAILAYTERRGRGGMALATIHAVPGLRAKAAFVADLLIPSREFLRARAHGTGGSSYRSRWRLPIGWMTRRRRQTRNVR